MLKKQTLTRLLVAKEPVCMNQRFMIIHDNSNITNLNFKLNAKMPELERQIDPHVNNILNQR